MRLVPTISDACDARRLFAPLANGTNEVVAIGYLDPKWRILGIRHIAGIKDLVRPPIRTIVRDALVFDAHAIILAHNHPSGDPTPSAADIAFTGVCARTLNDIDIQVVDHIIVARRGWTSFRERGLL